MAQQQLVKEERSLGDLFSELAAETSTLVRQEVALAQTELTQKATSVGKNVGFLVVGGAVGYAALLALLAAAIIGLAVFIPAWAAALIVAVVVGIVAFLLISSALKSLKETDLAPRQTVETLKEDAEWLKKSSELELNDASESNALSTIDAENETSLQTRDIEVTDDEATDETEQLREQIEETRRGMGETIDAIQEKLSFSNISEQVQTQVSEQINNVVETAKDAFYGKAGDIANTVGRGIKEIGKTDLAKKAKQNPAALAIIGAGIGALAIGLLVSGKKKKRDSYEYDFDYEDDSDDQVRYSDDTRRELTAGKPSASASSFKTAQKRTSDAATSAYKSTADAVDTAYEGAANAASSAYESVGDAAGKTYESISGVAGKTFEGISSAASRTYSGLGTAAGYTYEKAGDLGGQVKVNYEHYIEENPLAVGAVALALGAAVGFAIPLTSKENEYMGEYRDQVVEKAQEAAQDAIGSVKQMATDAQKLITEEVKSKTA